ncbi:MAG TPA: alpha/beta hydrolase [Allosphingosinicella sp.]
MSRRSLLMLLALSAAPAQAATPFKPTRISVAVRGAGPDVVLIHGLSASRGIWSGTVAAVPGYRYHLVQILGFAGTPAAGNAGGKVAAPVADEIARYIATQRLVRPAIVGHSMGGSIAMMLGARHPQAAGRVMVVDMLPSPARAFGVPQAAVGPLARLVGGEMQGADRLRRDLNGLIGRFGSTSWLESRSDSSVVGRSMEELLSTDLTPELPRIKAPLTVVYACPEPVSLTCSTISATYRTAYARRPGTRLVPVQRSGHTIMQDQPGVFQAALKSFLR